MPRTTPETKLTRVMQLRLSEPLYENLQIIADHFDVPVSETVRVLLSASITTERIEDAFERHNVRVLSALGLEQALALENERRHDEDDRPL